MSPFASLTLACAGGDNRDRTDDPLLAKQVLSQLSYTPVYLLKVFKISRLVALRFSVPRRFL